MAGYGAEKLPLPAASDDREAYLRQVITLDPQNATLQRRLARMLAPPEALTPPGDATPMDDSLPPSGPAATEPGMLPEGSAPPKGDAPVQAEVPQPEVIPITPDTCRPVVSGRIQDLQSN